MKGSACCELWTKEYESVTTIRYELTSYSFACVFTFLSVTPLFTVNSNGCFESYSLIKTIIINIFFFIVNFYMVRMIADRGASAPKGPPSGAP